MEINDIAITYFDFRQCRHESPTNKYVLRLRPSAIFLDLEIPC